MNEETYLESIGITNIVLNDSSLENHSEWRTVADVLREYKKHLTGKQLTLEI